SQRAVPERLETQYAETRRSDHGRRLHGADRAADGHRRRHQGRHRAAALRLGPGRPAGQVAHAAACAAGGRIVAQPGRVAVRKFRAAFAIAASVAFTAPLQAQITVPKTLPPATRAGGNITAKPVSGALPRQANGRPDLTGLWLRRGGIGNITQGLAKGETMPLLPETLKRMRALMAKDDPQLHCLPLPTPRA